MWSMILAIPPRPWGDSADQEGSAGSVDMRIGLMATIRDEALALLRFFRLLEAFESNCNVWIICSAVFTKMILVITPPSFWPPG